MSLPLGPQWLLAMKFVHIAAVCFWMVGLVALGLLLARYRKGMGQRDYSELRLLTHYGYVRLASPAAVIATGAGIVLIFMRELYVPWMFTKLALIGLLCVVHMLIGNSIIRIAEKQQPPLFSSWWLLGALLPVTLGILLLVLAKPALKPEWPQHWLETQERQLPLSRKVPN